MSRFLLALLLVSAADAYAGVVETGSFSVSDELGGFRLLSASGMGTKRDPLVIEEELLGIAPASLVVRRRIDAKPLPYAQQWRALYVVKRIRNASRRVWGGFEVELQERQGTPSVYGDGLSFDQGRKPAANVGVDAFGRLQRIFEPHDRLRFSDGFVDPEGVLALSFSITDPTPTGIFYIVQTPQLLSSGFVGVERAVARHEPTVDPLLQRQRRASAPPERTVGAEAGSVPEIECGEPDRLRTVEARLAVRHAREEIVRQNRCRAHAEDAEARQLPSFDVGAVSGREDAFVLRRVERTRDGEAAFVVGW